MKTANAIKRVFIARTENFLVYPKRTLVVDRASPIFDILGVCQKFALLEIVIEMSTRPLPTMAKGAWKNLVREQASRIEDCNWSSTVVFGKDRNDLLRIRTGYG